MTRRELIPLVVVPLLIAGGQLLFKQASQTEGLVKSSQAASLMTNPWLALAIVLYLTTTLWWVLVLRSVPLTRAYLFMALSFVYVPLLANLIFREPLSWRLAASMVLIVSGIALVAASAPPVTNAAGVKG